MLFILVGVALGFILDDLLKAAGLHWLTWPVIGLLALFALACTVIVRRRGTR
jgi:F0F1-type ATP synthase assembly protein I